MLGNQIPFNITLMKIKNIPMEISNGIVLFLVVEGSINIRVSEDIYNLSSDDIIVINAFEHYSLKSEEKNILLKLDISVEKLENYFGKVYKEKFECNTTKGATNLLEYQKLREILMHLMQSHFKSEMNITIETNQYFYELLSYLQKNFRKESIYNERLSDNIDERIVRILKYIKENYYSHLSLKQLADKEYMSYYHLSRIFSRELGVTFTEYVKNIRLNYALEDLQKTNESITKIAINNGFPNLKVFHKIFKETYGMTPGEYRKSNSKLIIEKSYKNNKSELEVLKTDDAMQEMAFYLITKDKEEEVASLEENLTIDISKERVLKDFSYKKILNIGDFKVCLDKIAQSQIEVLQRELNFNIISFTGLSIEDVEDNSLVYNREYIFIDQVFDFILSLNFVPLIKLKIPRNIICLYEEGVKWCNKQFKILYYLINRYGEYNVKNWYIEWSLNDYEKNSEENIKIYKYFYYRLKKMLPQIKLGLLTLTSEDKVEEKNIHNFLKRQNNNKMLPDFYTVHNNIEFLKINNLEEKNEISSYINLIYLKLKEILSSIYKTKSNVEIFITDWNTLSADKGIIAGTFFRAAIIIENIIDLIGEISGIGFWLNIESKNKDFHSDDILSLFFLYRIKRPVYFTVLFLDKLGSRILEKGENYLFTQDKDGFKLLLMNPCYFDPFYSVDANWLRTHTLEIKLCLKNIPKGEYLIKQYDLDKDHGGTYNEWLQVSYNRNIDYEAYEYLEKIVMPKLYVEKVSLLKEKMDINAVMTFNSCKLYIIKPFYGQK